MKKFKEIVNEKAEELNEARMDPTIKALKKFDSDFMKIYGATESLNSLVNKLPKDAQGKMKSALGSIESAFDEVENVLSKSFNDNDLKR